VKAGLVRACATDADTLRGCKPDTARGMQATVHVCKARPPRPCWGVASETGCAQVKGPAWHAGSTHQRQLLLLTGGLRAVGRAPQRLEQQQAMVFSMTFEGIARRWAGGARAHALQVRNAGTPARRQQQSLALGRLAGLSLAARFMGKAAKGVGPARAQLPAPPVVFCVCHSCNGAGSS
jgi:hypothetical protein